MPLQYTFINQNVTLSDFAVYVCVEWYWQNQFYIWPVIEVSGRTYPVEIRYRPMEPDEEGNTRKLTVLPRIKPLNKEKDLETRIVCIFREYGVRTVTETEVPAYLNEVAQLVAAR